MNKKLELIKKVIEEYDHTKIKAWQTIGAIKDILEDNKNCANCKYYSTCNKRKKLPLCLCSDWEIVWREN